MPMLSRDFGATYSWSLTSDPASALSRLEKRLPALLSAIAGMVDLIGYLTFGNIFTAHITGNLVVIAALVVRGGRMTPWTLYPLYMFDAEFPKLDVAGSILVSISSAKQGF